MSIFLEANEPAEIKNDIRKIMELSSGKAAIWWRNRLPSYLWKKCRWGIILRKRGWSWQKFLKLISRENEHLVKWVQGDLGWNIFLKILNEDIRNEERRLGIRYRKLF